MNARTYSHAEVTDMVMNHIAEFDEVARQRGALREVADLADDELRALLAERNDLLAALRKIAAYDPTRLDAASLGNIARDAIAQVQS